MDSSWLFCASTHPLNHVKMETVRSLWRSLLARPPYSHKNSSEGTGYEVGRNGYQKLERLIIFPGSSSFWNPSIRLTHFCLAWYLHYYFLCLWASESRMFLTVFTENVLDLSFVQNSTNAFLVCSLTLAQIALSSWSRAYG